MIRIPRISAKPSTLWQLPALCVLAASISACGGSSGTTDTQTLFGSGTDSDGDGLTDTEEATIGSDPALTDTDADGLDDGFEVNTVLSSPIVADSDSDGLPDGLEYNTLLTNPNLVDSDFDGTDDGDEDSDGDGVTDADEVANGTDPIVANGTNNPTPQACSDTNSSNDFWGDNCQLNRFGDYARSSYTQGVQRILWCQGNGQNVATITAFADGAFGPMTEQAVRDFQAANSIAVDGVVGPDTWNSLRSKLSVVSFSATAEGYDTHSIIGCDSDVQFYQRTVESTDASGATTTDLFEWQMARTPGSAERVDFSTGAPY